MSVAVTDKEIVAELMKAAPPSLTDSEVERLVLFTVHANGSATEPDLERVLEWAADIRIGQGLLGSVLSGHVEIVLGGESLAFRLTEKGRASVEEVIDRAKEAR